MEHIFHVEFQTVCSVIQWVCYEFTSPISRWLRTYYAYALSQSAINVVLLL